MRPALLGPLFLFAAAAAQSNVLLLVADDVGVDKIGAYGLGSNPPPTPHIDQLAAQGVLFRNAWSNPACSSTRATILTGRYAFRTGVGYVVGDECPPLPLSEYTLPEVLSDCGAVHSALIGKWHLGTDAVGDLLAPNLAGFPHFSGILDNLGTFNYYDWPKVVDGQSQQDDHYITTEQVDDALAWIATAPQPWFCQVSFSAAHTPFSAPPASLHSYNLPAQTPTPHGNDAPPFYDAIVQAMDSEIGRLFASLDAQLLARTLVLFVGDNGTPPEATLPPFLPQHAKLTLYEGGIRVPLIVSGPQVSEPGRESAALVNTVDLYSTLLQAQGLSPAACTAPVAKLDSVSLMPYLLSSSAPAQRTTVYSELFTTPAQGLGKNDCAIRGAQYKLIRQGPLQKLEFYDLLADPFELHNLLPAGLTVEQKRQLRLLEIVLQDLHSS